MRRFLHPAILRQRRAQQDCDPDAEQRFAENALVLLGEDAGDAAQDEAAMDSAAAVIIARAEGPGLIAVCRALWTLLCCSCMRQIDIGYLFTAELALGPCHEHAVCSQCRAFRVRVEVAA